jgi:signal transduction histidine kinase
VRRRIVGLVVLAALVAIALFGIPLGIGVARYYLDDERAELERLADTAAVAGSSDLLRGAGSIRLPPTESGTAIGVYSSGRLVAGVGPAQADPIVAKAGAGEVSSGSTDGHIVVAVPVPDQGTVTAIVRASASRTGAYQRTAITWLAMMGLAGVALGAAWLLARRQAAALAGPLERLAETTRRLGDSDFTVRTERAGIEEIDSVAATMNDTAERLGRLVARERSFSADASHQLRTPLTGLRLTLETAREAAEPATRTAISEALDSVDRLERTITDLLSLARDDDRQDDRPLDVEALLGEVRSDWHALLAAAGRPLSVTAEPDLPATPASAAATRQIIGVLIDNAVQHGKGAVVIRVRDADTAIAFDVSDEGRGPNQTDDQLFARRSPEADGIGIGLALARSLAEAQGGRLVHGESSGATFTLLLPATLEVYH